MNLQAHYIRLYKAADEILRQPDNPCAIRQESNGIFTCAGGRSGKVHNGPALCCHGCKHLGPEGCTAMALDCKLGWCYTGRSSISGMRVEDHPTFPKIQAIQAEALELGLIRPYQCRTSYRERFQF